MDPDVRLTLGHVVRHAPSKGGQGLEAALIDIAQDLLLMNLSASGVAEELAFKSGTALRKMFAGPEGRFSTDLDFSARSPDGELGAVVDLLIEAIVDTRHGPFRYGVSRRRGKPYVTIESDLGSVETLTCKLDVNPPPWLPTERRPWQRATGATAHSFCVCLLDFLIPDSRAALVGEFHQTDRIPTLHD